MTGESDDLHGVCFEVCKGRVTNRQQITEWRRSVTKLSPNHYFWRRIIKIGDILVTGLPEKRDGSSISTSHSIHSIILMSIVLLFES